MKKARIVYIFNVTFFNEITGRQITVYDFRQYSDKFDFDFFMSIYKFSQSIKPELIGLINKNNTFVKWNKTT